MKKPVIDINLDFQEKAGFSPYPWHAPRSNYFDLIREAMIIILNFMEKL